MHDFTFRQIYDREILLKEFSLVCSCLKASKNVIFVIKMTFPKCSGMISSFAYLATPT